MFSVRVLSEARFRQIVRLFSLDLNAVQIAELSDMSRVTIDRHLCALRERVVLCYEACALVSGEIEVDESYFGARRIPSQRGRDAFGKIVVFGMLQRREQVYTEIVPDCRKATLQAIIHGRAHPDSVIYSDGWRGYGGLVDVGYGKHFRVAHGRDEFVRGHVHINGIAGFWGFAKKRLTKFRGMSRRPFYLHLKECKLRFNHRHGKVYQLLLESCRKRPFKLSWPKSY